MIVDFLPEDAFRLEGRLGLTAAPGFRWPFSGEPPDRSLPDDLRELCQQHRARVLVTLLEEGEMRRLGLADLRREASRAGLTSLWLPIADMSVPRSARAAVALVAETLRCLARGETVVVHCLAGLGRSGTFAACCLVASGWEAPDAVRLVREVRPGAIQVAEQETFVDGFRQAWQGS